MPKTLATLLIAALLSGAAIAAIPQPKIKPMKVKGNPFFSVWRTPLKTPPFDKIYPKHYLEAFEEGIRLQKAEIDQIVSNPSAPSFRNTVAALDDSGEFLGRVNNVFGLLSGAETNAELQAIEAKIRPMLASHRDDIMLRKDLFQRVKVVWDARTTIQLTPEERTLLEHTYKNFVRGGAKLAPQDQERLRAINIELSKLIFNFSENLLAETNGYKLVIDKMEDLAGLPEGQVAAAAEAAEKAGLKGKWVFTLKSPSIWPFEQSSQNRGLRKTLLEAYASRCDHGDAHDNKAVFARIASLRVEKAKLLGYPTWADYVLELNMAAKPAKVYELLNQLWTPAIAVAKREAADLQAMMAKDLPGVPLEPCDWRYYAEKVRQARYDLDTEALKPYFSLDKVRNGAFAVANRLYGIKFVERKDLPVYNPEVQAFEVKEKDGRFLGVLYMDFYPRPGKRGGAWCSSIQEQWVKKGRNVYPIVYNVFNLSRPTGDTPALLEADEAETLFHEFGHALHALFSQCRFRGSGAVAQDFVELPSQIMENWAFEPEVLALYARHYKTKEVIPAELVEKLKKASTFNQGFATVEYLAASALDMDWHTLQTTAEQDARAFEKASMDKLGLIPEILPRYRTPYFHHAADEYSAGYYSYIWSAVLDSDAFQAFKEKGNLFDQPTAAAFRTLLAKSGSEDAMALFKEFRGREPKVQPLLDKRGLK